MINFCILGYTCGREDALEEIPASAVATYRERYYIQDGKFTGWPDDMPEEFERAYQEGYGDPQVMEIGQLRRLS